jgi:hypothetical protein
MTRIAASTNSGVDVSEAWKACVVPWNEPWRVARTSRFRRRLRVV